jgi:hypothetical protein
MSQIAEPTPTSLPPLTRAQLLDYGEYDENGVDLSLLKWMLQLTPLERLQVMDKHARDVELLLEYGRRQRENEARSGR